MRLVAWRSEVTLSSARRRRARRESAAGSRAGPRPAPVTTLPAQFDEWPAALPGVSGALSLTINPRLLRALRSGGERLRARGVPAGIYLQAIARALAPLENADARGAFLHTLRSVIDIHGQRVSANDRLYLLESMLTLIVWGGWYNTIPLQHGRIA